MKGFSWRESFYFVGLPSLFEHDIKIWWFVWNFFFPKIWWYKSPKTTNKFFLIKKKIQQVPQCSLFKKKKRRLQLLLGSNCQQGLTLMAVVGHQGQFFGEPQALNPKHLIWKCCSMSGTKLHQRSPKSGSCFAIILQLFFFSPFESPRIISCYVYPKHPKKKKNTWMNEWNSSLSYNKH